MKHVRDSLTVDWSQEEMVLKDGWYEGAHLVGCPDANAREQDRTSWYSRSRCLSGSPTAYGRTLIQTSQDSARRTEQDPSRLSWEHEWVSAAPFAPARLGLNTLYNHQLVYSDEVFPTSLSEHTYQLVQCLWWPPVLYELCQLRDPPLTAYGGGNQENNKPEP
eukprot:TRINITY_DN33915_c0_g1_i1.p1 TRINITY_DN33915_c0_g1~~TRINITY_DN33915_c0_g1_i1.p1  ORF type:complete len:163 (-),score=3.37 TRINITY_DN33915_c0_g1_i1:64-552(-)